jgi:hypothetical protein
MAVIDGYAALAPDWDGEGASVIDPRAIDLARSLLRVTHHNSDIGKPSIGPMPDGRLSFTWEEGEKELWIFVSAEGYTSHQWASPDEFTSVVSTWRDSDEVAELIEWLKRQD